MKTSFTLLPAINSLYTLGLSDAQIQDLKTQSESIEQLSATYKNDYLGTNVSYILRTKTMLIEIKPFLVDNSNSKIGVQKFAKNFANASELSPSIRALKENETAFVFSSDRYHMRQVICFNQFSQQTVALLSKFLEVNHYFYRETDTEKTIETAFYRHSKFVSDEEFKTMVDNYIPALLNIRNSLSVEHIRDEKQLNSFIKLIDNIFPCKNTTICPNLKDMITFLDKYDSLHGVYKVWEFNNTRVALILTSNLYNYYADHAYLIKIPHTTPAYNYLDIGRYSLFMNHTPLEVSQAEKLGQIIFSDMPPILPEKHVLEKSRSDLYEKNANGFVLINNDRLRLMTKRYEQRKSRQEKNEQATKILKAKISTRLEVLRDINNPKAELKLNNVTFKPQSIEYEGQILTLDNGGTWVFDIIKSLNYSWRLDDINFEVVFTDFIRRAQYKTKGKIGVVSFNIEKRDNRNVLGVTSTLTYINNYRINAAELEECLRRALCYEKQEDFDFFLNSVSTCSLQLHNYLQHGINLNLQDNFEKVSIVAKLPLERNKNLNYLVLGEKEYKVRNTHKLIRLEAQRDLLGAVTVLLDPEVVEGIRPEDIKDLIADAKTAYIDAVTKSKQLLTQTEKLFKLKRETTTLGDGKTKFGYSIQGKLRRYFIELNQNDLERSSCGVFDYTTGHYICIVDKGNITPVGMDKLINRIYALHNDSMLAPQISTLNRV